MIIPSKNTRNKKLIRTTYFTQVNCTQKVTFHTYISETRTGAKISFTLHHQYSQKYIYIQCHTLKTPNYKALTIWQQFMVIPTKIEQHNCMKKQFSTSRDASTEQKGQYQDKLNTIKFPLTLIPETWLQFLGFASKTKK